MEAQNPSPKRSVLPGDIILWDGINPDGTLEASTYFIAIDSQEVGLEGICLLDGSQNYFFPDAGYQGHLKIYQRENVSKELIECLPPRIQEYYRKYTEKKE